MRLGFCGLGHMGQHMARRLLDAGHEVLAWNRTAGKAERLREHGALVAPTPAETARDSDAVITMLADARALDAVVFGQHGVAQGLRRGSALIDMSTVGPAYARAAAERLPEGTEMVDAPVRGGPERARRGELKILVGATEDAYATWAPVLSAMGKPRHVGPPGAGAAAKVVNNFVGISLVGLLGEALALADAAGIQEPLALDLLASTPIAPTLAHQWPRVEARGVPPSFRLRLAAKDVALALEPNVGDGVALRMGEAALAWLREAEAAGLGEHDQSAVIPFIRSNRDGGATGANR